MKRVFIAFLISIAAITAASAQQVTLRSGQQRTVANGIRVKFVEVIADSRCPVGTTCIWAGNAKVKLVVTRRNVTNTIELNSTLDPRVAEFAGYNIQFVDLTPRTNKPGQPTGVRPRLTLAVTKVKR